MVHTKLLAALCFSTMFLGGCAATIDAIESLGTDVPSNAEPGYSSFLSGLKYERANEFYMARQMFCASAELGNSKASAYCEKYSILIGAAYRFSKQDLSKAVKNVCIGRYYGSTAAEICKKGLSGKDIAPDLQAYVESQNRSSNSAGTSRVVPQVPQVPQQATSQEVSRGNSGTDTSSAEPGYSSFLSGLKYEREKQFGAARQMFCASAGLGNSKAPAYCEKYSLLIGAAYRFSKQDLPKAVESVCDARNYGPTAAELCKKGQNGKDIAPGLRAYVESQKRFLNSLGGSKGASRGNSGGYSFSWPDEKPRAKSRDLVGADLGGSSKSQAAKPASSTKSDSSKKTRDLVGGGL